MEVGEVVVVDIYCESVSTSLDLCTEEEEVGDGVYCLCRRRLVEPEGSA